MSVLMILADTELETTLYNQYGVEIGSFSSSVLRTKSMRIDSIASNTSSTIQQLSNNKSSDIIASPTQINCIKATRLYCVSDLSGTCCQYIPDTFGPFPFPPGYCGETKIINCCCQIIATEGVKPPSMHCCVASSFITNYSLVNGLEPFMSVSLQIFCNLMEDCYLLVPTYGFCQPNQCIPTPILCPPMSQKEVQY